MTSSPATPTLQQAPSPGGIILGVTRLTLDLLRLPPVASSAPPKRRRRRSGVSRVARASRMLTGWLKLYRKMMENAVWTMADSHFKVWITCLLLANIREASWFNGRVKEIIPRGSFVTSREHLAKDANVSPKKVRQALANLEAIGAIRAQGRAKHSTLITIVNFDVYQPMETDGGQAMGQERAKRGPTEGHNERSSRSVEEKNRALLGFESFWNVYPRRVAKAKALEVWRQIDPSPEQVEQIVQAVKDQTASPQWTKDNGQFIPHPTTWLNQRRWDDQEPTPGPAPTGPVPMDPRELRRRDQEARGAGFRDHAHYLACLRRGVGSHEDKAS